MRRDRRDRSLTVLAGHPPGPQLIDEIAQLIREGVLSTSPGKKFGLDEIREAVTEAESVGRSGKILIAPA